MTLSPYDPSSLNNQTTASPKGGCLSSFIIPPLAVIIVGAILTVVLFNISPTYTPPVKAASIYQPTANTQAADIPAPVTPGFIQGEAGDISPIFMPEVQYWSGEIKAWAAQAGLDPNLVATVMQLESCGYQKALSRAGAIGLFQVMPFHFAAGDDPYDPNTNALRGLAYLKRSLEAANGDVALALAGYNGGIGVISQPASNWSGQTQNYAKVGNRIYSATLKSQFTAAEIQQWTSSDSALCRQAAAYEGINP